MIWPDVEGPAGRVGCVMRLRVVGTAMGGSRSLRPDLYGEVLDLTHLDTLALLPEETAALQVDQVQPTEDPEWVDVTGDWSGPDGDDQHDRIEIRASSLPEAAR